MEQVRLHDLEEFEFEAAFPFSLQPITHQRLRTCLELLRFLVVLVSKRVLLPSQMAMVRPPITTSQLLALSKSVDPRGLPLQVVLADLLAQRDRT